MPGHTQIFELNPANFEYQNYVEQDNLLIATSGLDTAFNEETDYIEYCVYDDSKTKIFPNVGISILDSYNVLKGDININPENDLRLIGLDSGNYYILYNIYRKRLNSSNSSLYYIKEISSDRREIRLDSNTIANEDIIFSGEEFISHRRDAEYFVDFYLNFGQNKTVIANNIKLDTTLEDDPTFLIKLYEPLPEEFEVKTELWVVEELSEPLLYQVKFPVEIIEEDNLNYIGGPNFNIPVKHQSGNSSQVFSLSELIDTNLTSSQNQIKSLLDKEEINININYENYSEFIKYSSAKTRLENFMYKVGLIESYTNSISASLGSISSGTQESSAFSASKASFEGKINDLVTQFDEYEYFLYFNSGSSFSYPKKTSSPPYVLYSTGSEQVLDWLGSADENNARYGGLALTASNYDEANSDYLRFAIPEYLRDDPDNQKYELFIDMVGQHYDNTWIYTKDYTNKFNADNRLEIGITKDLIDVAIKDFGVKLYSNQFDNDDLYAAFLGITPSGSAFPFPNITGSLPVPQGFEFVDTKISSSNDIVPLQDLNSKLYKRIYHNIPYLLKTKGTIRGLKALITSYGIPDTILRINEFGGKDRIHSNDWDLKQRVFNFEYDTQGTGFITASFDPNTNFGGLDSPSSVQLRFKTRGIPSGSYHSQSLFNTEVARSALILEYTGSGMASGSYSGSVPNLENKYGVLKFVPDNVANPNISSSLYLPFFDGDWWSVQFDVTTTNTASLHAANRIGNKIGHSGSSSVVGFDSNYYFNSEKSFIPSSGDTITVASKSYRRFSGSLQEIRFYKNRISSSMFHDYTMNPYSFEGNGINTTTEELLFRADLGTLINTGSRTSVHPKITGSATFITSSFTGNNSSFLLTSGSFIANREYIYQDQVPSGIKNRITDKITINPSVLASGNVLSSGISIEQNSFVSSSYTPNVNYLEVAFSPQDQINDDINSQMGYFNIGEYIGDPRHISQSSRNYPNLDTLRDTYFQKYIDSYDVKDFIRLVKFYDNSLFKMIKDFTPARTSLTSGVIVKQHILERNRVRPAQVTSSIEMYSGSVKPQIRDYNTGSGDVGKYEFYSGSSLYRFSGGAGGSFNKFNGLEFSPSASALNLSNRFGITQSYLQYREGKLGRSLITNFNQDEFYDGEFSGSNVTVTTQSLNPECTVYLKNPDEPLNYFPYFFSDPDGDSLYGVVQNLDWQDNDNAPLNGQVWFYVKTEVGSDGFTQDRVTSIKIAGVDADGKEVRDFYTGADTIQFNFSGVTDSEGLQLATGGIKTYHLDGAQIFSTYALLTVNGTRGDYLYNRDDNGGTENWSLRAYGNYSHSLDTSVPGFDPNSQGVFRALSTFQRQVFRFYNGGGDIDDPTVVGDPLNVFNSGAADFDTTALLNDSTGWNYGTYNLPRTPNIPLVLSMSLAYSSSGGGSFNSSTTTKGIYHTGSFVGANAVDQSFIITGGDGNGAQGFPSNRIFISLPQNTEGAAETAALTTPVFFTGSDGSTPSAPIVADLTVLQNIPGAGLALDLGQSLGFQGIPGKFYRIGNNHTAAISTGGVVSSLNRFQSSGNPTPVDVNFSKSGSYALPSIAPNQLTMDSTFYNTQINQFIPANSGSNSTLAAGEPQLRHNQVTTGSATIFWNHQSLTLGGTPPDEVIGGGGGLVLPGDFEVNVGGGGRPLVGGVAAPSFPLSGSVLQPNNAYGFANADYTNRAGGGVLDGTAGETFDVNTGEYRLDTKVFKVALEDQQPNLDFSSLNSVLCQLNIEVEIKAQSFFGNTNLPDMGAFAQLEMQRIDKDTGFSLGTQVLDSRQFTTSVNVDNPITISFTSIAEVRMSDVNEGTQGTILKFRLALGASGEGTIKYQVNKFKVDRSNAGALEDVGNIGGPDDISVVDNEGNAITIDSGFSFDPPITVLNKKKGTTLNNSSGNTNTTRGFIDINSAEEEGTGLFGRTEVTTFIYLTGSDGGGHPNFVDLNPKLPVARSIGTRVVCSGSGVINFPDSLITPISRRTSVTYSTVTIKPSNQLFLNIQSNPNYTNNKTIKYINPNYIGNGNSEFSSSITLDTFLNFEDGLTIPVKQNTAPRAIDGSDGSVISEIVSVISGSINHTLHPTGHQTGSMFFPQYEFDQLDITSPATTIAQINGFRVVPTSQNRFPILQITNSIDASFASGYRLTGSVEVWKGDKDNIGSLGNRIFNQQFIVPTNSTVATLSVSGSVGLGSTNFKHNDSLRLAVSVDKAGTSFLDITSYTMSLFPSESKYAQITENFTNYGEARFGTDVYGGNTVIVSSAYNKFSPPTKTETILSTFYGAGVLPFAIMLDCQPLVNNYNLQRESTYLMDADYNSSEGQVLTATGSFEAGQKKFNISERVDGIKRGMIIRYNNDQFQGPVSVTSVNNQEIFVNSKIKLTGTFGVSFVAPTFGITRPVNYAQIINNTAVRATVPDSNYTQEGFIASRYDGSKAQGSYINTWTPTDFGTYGQLPVLELKNAYFAYFSSIQDPYPIYNDSTRLNLSYLIDSQGNALPPSLQGTAKDIIDKTFPIQGNTRISLNIDSGSQELQELNEESTTQIIGKYPVPIMYSQTSSRGYADEIPLSGSGRVSLYDNEGSGFTEFSFTVEGTSSLTPGRNVTGIINPSENRVERDFGGGTVASQSYETGSIAFFNDKFKPDGTSGNANINLTSQLQYISIQTALPTTYIYSGDWKKKGNFWKKSKSKEYIEFTLKLGLKEIRYNNTPN